jgi:GNAT superfamily N-acetyltransferase
MSKEQRAKSDEWLALPLAGQRVRLEERDGGLAVVGQMEGETVGQVVLEKRGEALFVRSLCIDGPHRGYGLGSETARLLRRAAADAGWGVLRAWAPPERGLAVYFWCRMGLRPLHGEGPDGGIWFERRLG